MFAKKRNVVIDYKYAEQLLLTSFVNNPNATNMIFDIYGKQVENKIVFELPYHEFNWTDRVGIRRVIINWRTKEKAFAVIKSNLIDLGPCNPKRQLLAVTKLASATVTDIYVPDPAYYPVQITQLENVFISIVPMFDKEVPQIKNIYLQIESV